MPVILAQILRPVIIWLLQAAGTAAVYAVVDAIFNVVQGWVRDLAGVSEQDAAAVATNGFIDALTFVGAGALVLHKKLPITLARKLGFSGTVLVKQTLSSAGAQKVAAITVAAAGKKSFTLMKGLLTAAGAVATFIWLGIGVANVVEPGIYQPVQANNVWEKFTGVRPFPENDKTSSRVLSEEVFGKVYSTYSLAGAVGINDPEKLVTLIFNRENLIAVTDKIASTLLLEGKTADTKAVVAKLASQVIFPNGKAAPAVSLDSSSSTAGGSASGGVVPSTSLVKVFTGIVSQGVLGKSPDFTARPDDLIESLNELRSAASNNLASYLAALPGRIVYEVKIVPSVVTRDGFKQTGLTQRITVGQNTDGTPKYKTVTNKFAVIAIYAVTDKGTRTKLTQITLGPTNSAKLLVAQNDLRALETALPSLVTTSDLAEVSNVAKPEPVAEKPKFYGPAGIYTYEGVYYRVFPDYSVEQIPEPENKRGIGSASAPLIPGAKPYTKANNASAGSNPAPNAGGSVSSSSSPASKPGSTAATLSEWYAAHGLPLAPMSDRALLYQGYGLGQATYYTGTAEQNAKLLAAFKAT